MKKEEVLKQVHSLAEVNGMANHLSIVLNKLEKKIVRKKNFLVDWLREHDDDEVLKYLLDHCTDPDERRILVGAIRFVFGEERISCLIVFGE